MHGIPVSGGIAIGHAHLVSHARLEVAHYEVPPEQVAGELARFDAALKTVRADLGELRTQIPANAPQEFDAFLNLQADGTLHLGSGVTRTLNPDGSLVIEADLSGLAAGTTVSSRSLR